MRSQLPRATCRNCGREREADTLDRMRWCTACRAEVVRRSALWARGAALLVTLGVGLWIASMLRSTRFLMAWMLMLAACYFLVSKIVQRVAFEVIRSRQVPVPPENDA